MTCPVNVSLSGGYPDGRTWRRGQEHAESPQVRGISVGFSASTTGILNSPGPQTCGSGLIEKSRPDMTTTPTHGGALGRCDDDAEFEFALDFILDGLARIQSS